MRLGVCQWAVGRPSGVTGWAARLEREVAAAAAQGGELLVMPEYAPLEMAAGDAADVDRELRVAVDLAAAAIEAARKVARRHRVWLIPGTLPMDVGGRIINRAPLISAEGAVAFQDKHVMTRFEDERWGVVAGAPPSVFDTPWGVLGISVCFDMEFPALVRAQVEAGAWLILGPTCTDTMAGFNRVRIAAAARAMENQCFVGIAPTVGEAPWCGTLDVNRGYGAVFGPVDRGFPEDGVLARGALDRGGWVFADVERGALDVVRDEGQVRNHRSWPAAVPPARRVVVG